MKTLNIAVFFALLLATQVCGRPHKNEDDYPGDPPEQDYEDAEEDVKTNMTEPPSDIISTGGNIVVLAGTTVELPCKVSSGDFATRWKKGNRDLYVSDTRITKDDHRIGRNDQNSLTISNVTEQDSLDNYTCQLLTPSSKTIAYSLKVVYDPENLWTNDNGLRPWPQKIIYANESETVSFGFRTELEVRNPAWSHAGTRLHSDEQTKGLTITIPQVTRHNAGFYQFVMGEMGKEIYGKIELRVNYAPVIEVVEEVVHTGIDETSKLECRVYGHPEARTTWLRNGKEIKAERDRVEMQDTGVAHHLIIRKTTKLDLGTFTCVGSNAWGEANKDIELTGRPSMPKFVGGKINDDDSTFSLSWKVKSFSPIVKYQLEYRSRGTKEWQKVGPQFVAEKNENDNSYTVEYEFKNFLLGSYEGRLKAQNDFGWSAFSSPQAFKKEVFADEPQNVKGSESSATTRQPFTVLAALLLVVASCVSINL